MEWFDRSTDVVTAAPTMWSSICEELEQNVTIALNQLNRGPTDDDASVAADAVSDEKRRHLAVGRVINDVGVPAVSLFGIAGNVLNLVVLTRKQLQRSMDRMEKSVQMGLVALAVSDTVVCLMYFIAWLVVDRMLYTRHDSLLVLYYNTYQEPLLNIFLLSSTWLTVTMALARYAAVCYPLHARSFISLRGTRLAIAGVFVGSAAFNLPRFWHYAARRDPCPDLDGSGTVDACPSCYYHVKVTGALYGDKTFVFVYSFACSVVGIFVPLVVLTLCNVCLVRALRRSHRLQKLCRANRPTAGEKEPRHRITPTLVGLIVLFTLLVGPSEILAFFRDHVLAAGNGNVGGGGGGGGGADGSSPTSSSRYLVYSTATVVTNFMQLINFAVNFVLYCVVNVQFRRTVRDAVCCACFCRRRRGDGRQRRDGRRSVERPMMSGSTAAPGAGHGDDLRYSSAEALTIVPHGTSYAGRGASRSKIARERVSVHETAL